ncbi:MAG: hypothetical protein HRT37_01395 [Alteromonadaceae bacterium]|nr:hypothetical protein [Alteromonadaceae bacterium]
MERIIPSRKKAVEYGRHTAQLTARNNARITACVLTTLGCLSLITPLAYASTDYEEDKLDIIILQNTSYDECAYSGAVVLEVKYQLNTQAFANMVLKGSEDGSNFYQILSKESEEGRGSRLLKFNAEPCLQAIELTFE